MSKPENDDADAVWWQIQNTFRERDWGEVARWEAIPDEPNDQSLASMPASPVQH